MASVANPVVASRSEGSNVYIHQVDDWYGTEDKLRFMQAAHAHYTVPAPPDYFGWVMSWLDMSAGERLLDVGCGFGAFHVSAKKHGFHVIGLDQSQGLVGQMYLSSKAAQLGVSPLCAWAEEMPLRDDIADGTMCNYVMHHLDDAARKSALEQMLRVTKNGRNVVITAHAANQMQRLRELHFEAATQNGFVPRLGAFDWFNLDHIEEVSRVFPEVRVESEESRFEFPETEIVVRYYASQIIDLIENQPADNAHRKPLLEWVRPKIDDVIRRDGVFKEYKSLGCFVATVRK